MSALIKRELLILKNNFILFICSVVLLPMFIYLFISIPFSFYIELSNGINYLHWSSVGNWISSSVIMCYIISNKMASEYRKESSLSSSSLAAPISNNDHLMAIIIWSTLIGFSQLVFSIFITLSLNSSNLFFTDIILAIIYIIPIILAVSNIGLFVGISSADRFLNTVLNITFLIVLLFSSGLFLPLDSNLPFIFLVSPLYMSCIDIQSIITNDPSMIHSALIMLFLSFAIYIINLIISSKVFRS